MTIVQFLLPLCLVAGCSTSASDEDDSDTDTDAGVAEDSGEGWNGTVNDVDPDDLNGSVPEIALAAPEFAATNRDGAARDREDLLGHPTVMWFYPAAATAG